MTKIRPTLIDGFIYVVIDGRVAKRYPYLHFYSRDAAGMMIERKKKKKAPFLKKKTNTQSKKPHDLSNWAIYLDHHGVIQCISEALEWDLPEGSRRLKGLSPGACSSGSRRDRHCRRSLWGTGPGSRRWADPTRTGRSTPSVPCGGPSLWADHSHNMRWSVTIVWRL